MGRHERDAFVADLRRQIDDGGYLVPVEQVALAMCMATRDAVAALHPHKG